MESRLTIRLVVIRGSGRDTLIRGNVTHQDEELRHKKDIAKVNGFRLTSCDRPELRNDVLYIRGRHSDRDDDEFSKDFSTYVKALEIVKKIEKVVESIGGKVIVTLKQI